MHREEAATGRVTRSKSRIVGTSRSTCNRRVHGWPQSLPSQVERSGERGGVQLSGSWLRFVIFVPSFETLRRRARRARYSEIRGRGPRGVHRSTFLRSENGLTQRHEGTKKSPNSANVYPLRALELGGSHRRHEACRSQIHKPASHGLLASTVYPSGLQPLSFAREWQRHSSDTMAGS